VDEFAVHAVIDCKFHEMRVTEIFHEVHIGRAFRRIYVIIFPVEGVIDRFFGSTPNFRIKSSNQSAHNHESSTLGI